MSVVLAAAAPVAAELVEQAVAAEVAARASATLALLVLSRGQALTPQRL